MLKSERFEEFVKARFDCGDWNNYVSSDCSRLVRRKILEACGFPRASFYQNRVIKQRLFETEVELRRRGILRQTNPMPYDLLDEQSMSVAAVELGARLDKLCDHMSLIRSSIEKVCCQLQEFAKG